MKALIGDPTRIGPAYDQYQKWGSHPVPVRVRLFRRGPESTLLLNDAPADCAEYVEGMRARLGIPPRFLNVIMRDADGLYRWVLLGDGGEIRERRIIAPGLLPEQFGVQLTPEETRGGASGGCVRQEGS